MLKLLKYQWFSIIWLIIILILCFGDTSKVSKTSIFFQGFDKIVHLGFFYIWTTLILFGHTLQQKTLHLPLRTYPRLIALTALVGASIELLQLKLFKSRSAEMWDFICDMLGVSMALGNYLIIHISNHYAKKN